jgi:hypothetical protein
VIDDRDDVAQALVGDRLKRLPDLTFLQLAVAGHHHHSAAHAVVPVGARHAVCLREAHAERAGVGRDGGRPDVRMSRQPAEAAQTMEQIEIEPAERDEQRIQGRRVVPLRRKVRVRAGRAAVRIDQFLRPQPGDQIHRAEARSDVARAGLHDHVERVQPADIGDERRTLDWIRRRVPHGVNRFRPHVHQPRVTGQRFVRVIFLAQ